MFCFPVCIYTQGGKLALWLEYWTKKTKINVKIYLKDLLRRLLWAKSGDSVPTSIFPLHRWSWVKGIKEPRGQKLWAGIKTRSEAASQPKRDTLNYGPSSTCEETNKSYLVIVLKHMTPLYRTSFGQAGTLLTWASGTWTCFTKQTRWGQCRIGKKK